MATGKHIGKVVLKVRDEESQKAIKPATKYVDAIPRTYMHPDKSYVLVGKYLAYLLTYLPTCLLA